MKLLSGRDIADYIKERQMQEVHALKASHQVVPKLAIIKCIDDPVINTYVRLKKAYGADIGVEVELHEIDQAEASDLIKKLNADKTVHAIIVQLPLRDPSQTDEIVNQVDPAKDVDALGAKALFDPATPMAILWLLAGYNINLNGKKILIIGRGKLVGTPLARMLENSGHDVTTIDRSTKDLAAETVKADVIVAATGSPAILYPNMIKVGAVVVDAGTASEDGHTVGDLAREVYERQDLTITPAKGGVGPLTVCSLFENTIKATCARGEIKTA